MSKSPAEVLHYYLISQGLFTSPSAKGDFPLFITTLPGGKDVEKAGCVSDTSFIKDGRLMTGETIIHPGIQIRIRTRTFEEGWMKMRAIASLLEMVHNLSIVISADDYYTLYNVSQTSAILPMGQDPETRLFLFSINYITTIKEN